MIKVLTIVVRLLLFVKLYVLDEFSLDVVIFGDNVVQPLLDEKGLIYNVNQNIGRVVENRIKQEYQSKILIQYIN